MAALEGKIKARVIAFVVWPESTNIDRLDAHIGEMHVQAARSPLHKSDEYTLYDVDAWIRRCPEEHVRDWYAAHREDVTEEQVQALAALVADYVQVPRPGDVKKPHYHYMFAFRGPKTLNQVRSALGEFCPSHIEKVEDKGGYMRYLCHLDSPDKARYSIEDVKLWGGMDSAPLYAISDSQRMDYTQAIIDHIYGHGVTSMNRLIRWARSEHDYQLFDTLMRRYGFFAALMSSYGNDRAALNRRVGLPGGLVDVAQAVAAQAEESTDVA